MIDNKKLRSDSLGNPIEGSVRPERLNSEADLSAGDWVEVRSKDEILRTLDKSGRLEGMPFMPEMFAFVGRRFRVYKRAHKTCDTVNDYKGRKLKNSVHLMETRCDGSAHDGCEAGCLFFWKTQWLRRVPETGAVSRLTDDGAAPTEDRSPSACDEADVLAATVASGSTGAGGPAYVCQATLLPAFTESLSAWELGQYLEDYKSGNTKLTTMVSSFLFMGFHHWLVNLGIGWGPVLSWLYDLFQRVRGGTPYPRHDGKLPAGSRTPTVSLNLQPGEWVRVKSRDEILATCDTDRANRGMKFDAEMVPYCGGVYRVHRRINKILNEKTGVMQEMKTPSIVLDSVVCQARYADCRLFCPRSVYPYWREIWLERVEPSWPSQNERAM